MRPSPIPDSRIRLSLSSSVVGKHFRGRQLDRAGWEAPHCSQWKRVALFTRSSGVTAARFDPGPAALRNRLGYVAAAAGLATVYFVAARLGLMMDAVAGFATLVWPATGIALAALVLFGYRL